MLDVKDAFFNISKAFDKVWRQGLIFKSKSYGAKGKFLYLMTNYLHGRMQRVVLNGQCSSWELIQSGILQDSVLGLVLFLIYINDLLGNVKSTCKIFANETSLFSSVFNKNFSRNELNTDLQSITDWAY